MTEHDDLEHRLSRIGAAAPPPLSGSRRASIEARVMAHVQLVEPTQTSAVSRRVPAFAMAAAVLLVVAVAVVVLAAPSQSMTVGAAEGVVLELPDGAQVALAAGERVPDKATVIVADGGYVMIGQDRYGAGRYGVDDGRLVEIPEIASTVLAGSSSLLTTTTTTTLPDESPPVVATGTTVAERPPPVTSPTVTSRPITDSTRVSEPPRHTTEPPRRTTEPRSRDRKRHPTTTIVDRTTTSVGGTQTSTTVHPPRHRDRDGWRRFHRRRRDADGIGE